MPPSSTVTALRIGNLMWIVVTANCKYLFELSHPINSAQLHIFIENDRLLCHKTKKAGFERPRTALKQIRISVFKFPKKNISPSAVLSQHL